MLKFTFKRRSPEDRPILSAAQTVEQWMDNLGRGSKLRPVKLGLAFCLPLVVMAVAGWLGIGLDPAGAQDAAAAPKIDTGDAAFMLVSSALVLLMTPGLAFFYGGLTRSKNVLNIMMMSFVSMAIVSVTWVLWGYSLSFNNSDATFKDLTTFADGIGKFIGGLGWAGLNGVGLDPHPIYSATFPHQTFMVYQMMFAIITVALISGAIAERMSFKAYCWFMLLWSTLVYCPLAHMVWGRGLLQSMGALDFAGGTVVHISSGVSALVLAQLLGPRKDFARKPILPHNVPYVLLGVGLLWFGWYGFNAGSALAAGQVATVAFVATTMGAATAGLTWMMAEWLYRGKPTAVGIGSGFVAGLVGITPAAGFVTPMSAILIGAITSLCCFMAVNLKAKLKFDDALDTFPVHGVGGTVGALLTGIFATKQVNSAGLDGLLYGNGGQVVTQLIAVLIAYGFAAIMTLLICKAIGLFTELRVSEDMEADGLDIHEHGEGAYGEEIAGSLAFAHQPFAHK
jgi:ammonium transporter, Amt family